MYFKDCYAQLANDSEVRVRKTIGSSLPDIFNILKTLKQKYLKDIFVHLFKDSNMEVKESVITKLPQILSHFLSVGDDQRVC